MQDLEELKARREQLKQMKAIREANKNLQNVKIANETVRLPNLTNAPQAPTIAAGSGYANQLYNQPVQNIPQTVSDIKLNTGAGDAVTSTNEVKNILAKNEEYPHTVRGKLRTIGDVGVSSFAEGFNKIGKAANTLSDIASERLNGKLEDEIKEQKEALSTGRNPRRNPRGINTAKDLIDMINNTSIEPTRFQQYIQNQNERAYSDLSKQDALTQFIGRGLGTVAAAAPPMIANAVAPGTGSIAMFLTSGQGAFEKAKSEGATNTQALSNAILSGTLETTAEKFGGESIAKLTGMPTLLSKLGITSSNKLVSVLTDVASEGLEEMVSTGVQPIIDRITYNPNAQFATAQDYWQSFTESILPTLIFSGINASVEGINNYKQKAIEKVNGSNMDQEQKASAAEQINQGANELTSTVKQSLGDREITQSNQQVEVPTHIKTFVENRNKTTPGLSVEMDNTISTEWSKYLKENWDLMPNSTKTMAKEVEKLNLKREVTENNQDLTEKMKKEVDTLSLAEKPSKVKKLEDIADLTENDIKTKEMKYKQRADKNTANQGKFFENVETSKSIAQETKDRVNATTYKQKANMDTLEKVRARLDERGNEMIDEWKTKSKNFTDQDVALGAIIIERYQQNGDWESAARTVEKLADMAPEAGRAVQMYSIFQRLSPETMAIYQQKELTKAFEDLKKKKTGKWVEQNKDKFKLTAEDTQFIYDQVEKAQQATDKETKQRELSKIEARINNKLPPEAGQTLKAWRRIAMLLNPKTQVRNIGGNTTIMPVNAVADAIGTQIDKAIAKKTGVRTTNYTNLKNITQGFGKGIKDAVTDYKTGTRTIASGSRYEFEVGAKPFNENTKSKTLNAVNNKLNGVNNLLSAVMSGGDRPFYEAAYKNSLEGQMKANNVTEPTQEMIDIAVNEALTRTWNDNNNYTQVVLGIRRAMNKINIKGFGFGDLVIPFAKTPANLTKAMVEYSPAGFIDTVIKGNDLRKAISRGEMTAQQQKDFVSSMSKAITGTILYVIAASLVKAGKITGSKDKDKDVANFEQNVLGIQPYSVKIGDKTYTYNWATPINAPLAIMANTYKMSKDDASLWNVLTNAFKVAGNTLVENSFLQGIKELFDADSITEGLVQAVENFPSSLIPTFISQFASLADNTKRQIFEYKNEGKSTLNSIAYKLPGARNKLAPQVNTFGEEISNQNNWFNAFLNPANVREAETTDAQKELYSLYEATKDATIFPRQAPYNVGGTNLTSQNKADYQKKSGQYVSENLDALFDSDFYKQLDDNAKKAELVNKVISDADILAKSDYQITTTTEKLLKKIDSVKQSGLDMSDYYKAWSAQDGVKGYKDSKGNTIDLSESRNKKKAIDEATKDLSELERMKLYRIFDISQKVW